jgi:signal transduction histidine kinase
MKAHSEQTPEQREEIGGSKSLLEAFFNNAPDYQILLNEQLEIVSFNRVASAFTLRFFNQRLENGKTITHFISPSFAPEFEGLCKEALDGVEVKYEHFIRGNGEEGLWYGFTIIPIYKERNKVIGLTLLGSSINEQKKQEKTIKHQNNTLSVIAQLQSHQIRQPVSSILGLMDLIRQDDYVMQKEYLEALEAATNQLDTIIQAIVNQSRMK